MTDAEQRAILEEAKRDHQKRREREARISVVLILLALIAGALLYKWSTGTPSNETAEERESRLHRCAEVYGTTPTFSERLEGDDHGVCSGFSEEEIESLRASTL